MTTVLAHMADRGDSHEVAIEAGDHYLPIGVVNSGDGMFDTAEYLLEQHGYTPADGQWEWHEVKGDFIAPALQP
jgi:hypothetical protein